MDLEYYTKRLPCTREEKESCLETVRFLVRANEYARRNGLLALGEQAAKSENAFFRDGVLYLSDAPTPDDLRRALELMLAAGDCQGNEFLNHALIVEGILAIQAGYSSETLAGRLASCFGAGWRKTVEDTIRAEMALLAPGKARKKSLCPEFDRLLEIPPERRDTLAQEIWAAAREKPPELLLALMAAGAPVKQYLLEGLTPDQREDVRRTLEEIFFQPHDDLTDVQRRVANRILSEGRGCNATTSSSSS